MELTIGQLIKIIIGVLVFVVVVIGVYFFFKTYVFGFFQSNQGNETARVLLALVT